MQIFAKTFTGKTITLQVKPSECVDDVKARIEEKVGIPTCQQTLVNGSKILEEGKKSLSFYKVTKDITLQMILRWNRPICTSTLNEIEDNSHEHENTGNKNEEVEDNQDDACNKFQDKLVKSMTFEMNREVEMKMKTFKKLEEQRVVIDENISELETQLDRNMIGYEERKERKIKYRGTLWEDHYEAQKEKNMTDKKIKVLQDESFSLELKMKEKTKKMYDVAKELCLDTEKTYSENNKTRQEIDILKRKRSHNENEKDELFKKKKVKDGLVEFISITIEEKKAELKCPVCFEIAETPIYMCSMAHLICKLCLPRLKICPECRKPYPQLPVRHRFAEKLDEEIKKLFTERNITMDGI